MIDPILDLCRLLTGERLSLSDLVFRLGEPVEDRGEDGPVTVAPSSQHFGEATILREDERGEPYLVILKVAAGEVLTVGDLTAAFGAAQERTRLRVFEDVRPMFMYDEPERPFVCVLIATVALPGAERAEFPDRELDDEGAAAGRVVTLSLRRDRRLR